MTTEPMTIEEIDEIIVDYEVPAWSFLTPDNIRIRQIRSALILARAHLLQQQSAAGKSARELAEHYARELGQGQVYDDDVTAIEAAIIAYHKAQSRGLVEAFKRFLLLNWPENRGGMDYELLPLGIKAARKALADWEASHGAA